MSSIATLTLSPTIDLSSEVDQVVATHKMRTGGDTMDPGGGGINVARVVAELGGEAMALALAGGETGTIFERLLLNAGVDCRIVPASGRTRISHTIYERHTGLEYRFVPAGPELLPAEIEALLALVGSIECGYFVASGSLPAGAPTDLLVRIGRLVTDRGARFVLDSSGPGLTATLGRVPVHLVKPSLSELEAYVGRSLSDPRAQDDAARHLVATHAADIVAVTLGAQGALLATSDGVSRRVAPKVETRSTVGAGDSFLAAMTLALSRGEGTDAAFCAGMAAGAAAAMTPGTRLSRREDVERLYQLLCRSAPPAKGIATPEDREEGSSNVEGLP